MGQERVSITVENPTNPFNISKEKLEKLKNLSEKQINDIFEEANQSLKNYNNRFPQKPVSHEICEKPFEIVK